MKLIERLKTAERPVVLGGTGIRIGGAHEKFSRRSSGSACRSPPRGTRMTAVGGSPLLCRPPATVGDRAGNFAVQNSDLLIVLGCRLNVRQIGYIFASFARAAYKVVVDIDPVELQKPTIQPDLPVHSDVGFFVDTSREQLGDPSCPTALGGSNGVSSAAGAIRSVCPSTASSTNR